MSAASLFICHMCSAPASKRCGRCKAVHYCSPTCQRLDWPDHKRVDCPLLPSSFRELPQTHTYCFGCGHPLLLCVCHNNNHDGAATTTAVATPKGSVFVMPPVPAHYTFLQRVRRWALLLAAHPQLGLVYDAERFLDDILVPNLEEDMAIARPIIERQMNEYKSCTDGGGLEKICDQLAIPNEGRPAAIAEMHGECDYIMEKFFAGDWALPSRMEYVFLYNAIQMSGPEDFDEAMARRFERVLAPVSFIAEIYKSTWPCNESYAFRLEDEENFRR